MKKIEIKPKFENWFIDEVAKRYPELDYINDSIDEDNELEVKTQNPEGYSGYVNIFEFIIAHKIPLSIYDEMIVIYDDEDGGDDGL